MEFNRNKFNETKQFECLTEVTAEKSYRQPYLTFEFEEVQVQYKNIINRLRERPLHLHNIQM